MKYDSAVKLAYAIGREVDTADLLLRLLEANPTFVLEVANGEHSTITAEVRRLYAVPSRGNFTNVGYIEAIKYYRAQTGASLKEAKDAVDKIVGRV